MRFTSTLAAAASLASLASARIYGIAVPDTIKPGEGFNLRILSENYIQSVYDVAIAVGSSPPSIPVGSLGTVLGSYYLGPEQSNQGSTYFSKWVQVPSGQASGQVKIEASLFSLYGAGSAPTLSEYNVTVNYGDFTSSNYVTSS